RQHAYLGMAPARDGDEPRRYLDSGMEWVTPTVAGPAEESDERSLWKSDPAEATADVAAYLRHVGADLVVSYDTDGGYGHPDHVRSHEVAKAAAAEVGVPFAALTAHRELADKWWDLESYRQQVATALRHHRTQLTVHEDGATITHSGGQTERFITSTGLRGDFPHLP
ncbi:MAG TPA: hypothetical protein K8V15_00880, partial [Tessaracoccus flavescens]|nr:hypothetical protein [Tessaracoccus flavescens]